MATPEDCNFGRGRRVRFFSGGAGRGGRVFAAIGAGGLFSLATGCGRAADFGGFATLSFDLAVTFAEGFFGETLWRRAGFLAAARFAAALFFPCALAIAN